MGGFCGSHKVWKSRARTLKCRYSQISAVHSKESRHPTAFQVQMISLFSQCKTWIFLIPCTSCGKRYSSLSITLSDGERTCIRHDAIWHGNKITEGNQTCWKRLLTAVLFMQYTVFVSESTTWMHYIFAPLIHIFKKFSSCFSQPFTVPLHTIF